MYIDLGSWYISIFGDSRSELNSEAFSIDVVEVATSVVISYRYLFRKIFEKLKRARTLIYLDNCICSFLSDKFLRIFTEGKIMMIILNIIRLSSYYRFYSQVFINYEYFEEPKLERIFIYVAFTFVAEVKKKKTRSFTLATRNNELEINTR